LQLLSIFTAIHLNYIFKIINQGKVMKYNETHFMSYRDNIIGIDTEIETPYGLKPLIYCDWIASGRLYRPIEEHMIEKIGPMIGNTHSEASATGDAMTKAYQMAQRAIKHHVNAGEEDVLILAGNGMTAVINKLQRIMGLRLPEQHRTCYPVSRNCQNEKNCPVVFITHMEHHSNHISWLETIAEVVIIPPGKDMLVEPEELVRLLIKYKDHTLKIGSFTAASNVTGIIPDYHELARIMHSYGGLAFIDFAASAPYVSIDMHPENDPEGSFDAIFFSPHKFLGGPGSSGVVIFKRSLYVNKVPDHPGGGTVNWTNRWNERSYVKTIESREDGGTPGFLQTIRVSLAISLKDQMNVTSIAQQEERLLEQALTSLRQIKGLHILGDNQAQRIGVISFYLENVHHNMVVKLLNDHYGIQVRGGCSCAGTYGHILLDVNREHSNRITQEIEMGNLSHKPGWVRLSLHPTMTNDELDQVLSAIREVTLHVKEMRKDYRFEPTTGEFYHRYWKKPEVDWVTLGGIRR
jgi:selenocysteine lyase/cysteine desulfurase